MGAGDVEQVLPDVEQDVRGLIAEVLNETATKTKIRDLIDRCLDLKGLVKVHCPECRRHLMAEYPDVKKQADALLAFTSEAWGKPKDDSMAGTTIIVERPPRDTEEKHEPEAQHNGSTPA